MIFKLAQDFRDAVEAMPREHPKHRMLELLEEAIRRDIHFIDRHPTTLFQCMWNTCWWYEGGDRVGMAHDDSEDGCPDIRSFILEFRRKREGLFTGRQWVRSLRASELGLGSGERAVIRGYSGPVVALALSPDARVLICGGLDGAVYLCDWRRQQIRHTRGGHASALSAAAVSSDSVCAATADVSGRLLVWDIDVGCCLGDSQVRSRIVSITFRNENELLVACEDGTLWSWHWQEMGSELLLCAGSMAFRRAAFSGDAHRMVSADASGTVAVWDVPRKERVRRFRMHHRAVEGLSISRFGDLVCSVDVTGDVCLWDVETEACIASLQMIHRPASNGPMCIVAPLVHIGCWNGVIESWDFRAMEIVSQVPVHAGPVTCVAPMPDGHLVVSGSYDATVRVRHSIKEVRVAADHDDVVTCMYARPIGDLLVSGARDGTVCLTRPLSGELCWRVAAHDGFVTKVGIAADAPIVVTGGSDGMVRVWDTSREHCRHTLDAHQRGVCGLAVSADGGIILSASRDGQVLFTGQSGAGASREVDRRDAEVTALAVSPSGDWGFVGDEDGTLCVYDLRNTGAQAMVQHCGSPVVCFDARVPGKVAAGTEDGTVVLWHVEKGEVYRLKDHRAAVTAILVDADLAVVLSGDLAGTVRARCSYQGVLMGLPASHEAGIRSILNAGETGSCVCVDELGEVSCWERRSLLRTCRFSCGAPVACATSSEQDPGWIACGTETGGLRLLTIEKAGGMQYASAE